MEKKSFLKLCTSTIGISMAVLALTMTSPNAAMAVEEEGGGCGEGGPVLCRTLEACVGIPPLVVCTTDYFYKKAT